MKQTATTTRCRLFGAAAFALALALGGRAQVPANIEAELKRIGPIVDPACTAKLYRPLMPKNDFNTYWPPEAPAPVFRGQLYPGITIARDQPFGPDPKDVLDIFTADKGGANRPVLIYVPGGAGNKIEQQVREANAFYDNIGRWAAKNGLVGVLVQRHPGSGNWDDGGRDLARAVDWLVEHIASYKGDPTRMVIWAHSAGNGPLGVYIGHPDRWKNGVQVKGAIFMSGNPVPGIVAGAGRGGPAGAAGGAPAPGSTCGVASGLAAAEGSIAGPSGQRGQAFGRGRGGVGAGRGGPPLAPEEQAERDNLPGFKATPVKIMIAFAELDPGIVDGAMPPSAVALHDALCQVDGPNARDGVGHCPTMLMARGESHMSEVFSIDTADKTVSGPVLAFVRKVVGSK